MAKRTDNKMAKFTSLKSILWICALIVFPVNDAFSQFFYPLQNGKKYLRTEIGRFPIILQDASSLKPVFTLDEKGLFFKGREFCRWADLSAKIDDMVFDKYCPIDTPMIATYGDHGTGTAALFVRVDKQNRNKIYVNFRGQNLFLETRSLPFTYEFETFNENEWSM